MSSKQPGRHGNIYVSAASVLSIPFSGVIHSVKPWNQSIWSFIMTRLSPRCLDDCNFISGSWFLMFLHFSLLWQWWMFCLFSPLLPFCSAHLRPGATLTKITARLAWYIFMFQVLSAPRPSPFAGLLAPLQIVMFFSLLCNHPHRADCYSFGLPCRQFRSPV